MRRAILVFAISGAVLVCHLLAATTTRWIADDYCFAARAKEQGFWAAQKGMYVAWGGRYTATLLISAATALGRWTAPLLPAAALLLWLLAARFAIRRAAAVAGWQLSRVEEWAVATALVAATIGGTSAPFQSLMWTTGLLSYGITAVAWCALLGLLLAPRRSTVDLLWPALIAFAAGGLSETAALVQVAVLPLVALVRPVRAKALAALGGGLLAMAIVAASPGNRVRQAEFRPAPIPAAAASAVASAPSELVGVVTTRGFPLLFVGAAMFGAGSWTRARNGRIAAGAILAAAAAIAAALFASLAGTGLRPPDRARFISWFCVVIATAVVALALRGRATARIAAPLIIAVAGGASVIAAMVTLQRELPPARAFAEAADAVHARASSGRGHLTVAAPRTWTMLHFLEPDPAHWCNRCVSRYYGLDSIRGAASPD
jgi:hypothetical protein